MTERERLLDKLEKVRALAERGVGGEKESAERTLAALMERYGITEEDLEDSKTSIHWIRYKTKWGGKTAVSAGLYVPGNRTRFWVRGHLHRKNTEESGDRMYPGPVHRD